MQDRDAIPAAIPRFSRTLSRVEHRPTSKYARAMPNLALVVSISGFDVAMLILVPRVHNSASVDVPLVWGSSKT